MVERQRTEAGNREREAKQADNDLEQKLKRGGV